MPFADLIRQSDTNLICVQSDTVFQGLFLIKQCIEKKKDDQEGEIHWFCYSVCSKDLRNELNLDNFNRQHNFYDCFPSSCFNTRMRIDMTEQLELLRQRIGVSCKKLIVIIDSFSTLANEDDFFAISDVFREIYSFRKNTSQYSVQLFFTIHGNASHNVTAFLKHLRYLTNIWLVVAHNTVSMKVRKSNGRIIKQSLNFDNFLVSHMEAKTKIQRILLVITLARIKTMGYAISMNTVYEYNDNDLAFIKKINVPKTKSGTFSDDNLCSFKLDLTDQEKEARNAVQLPYVRHSDSTTDNEISGTKIHYNPDEYDDWDEEEPDNDLEFV